MPVLMPLQASKREKKPELRNPFLPQPWRPDARLRRVTVRANTPGDIARRNLEEEREKARERMARHRQKIQDDEDLAREFRARAREASKTYRHRAFNKKHGHRAWLERCTQLEERRAAARELEEDLHQREELRRIEKEFEREQR
ncbi:hypothetical protein B0H14DRAFT_2642309 [Mycena olivaceomarginata]|nr:hypothetical protein B0H14DRAFT_2642309 [Mycena olivaceomarginata]